MLCFISFKIPQLIYFPIMESSSQRILWLKIDKVLDKNVNRVNLRVSQAVSSCFNSLYDLDEKLGPLHLTL